MILSYAAASRYDTCESDLASLERSWLHRQNKTHKETHSWHLGRGATLEATGMVKEVRTVLFTQFCYAGSTHGQPLESVVC